MATTFFNIAAPGGAGEPVEVSLPNPVSSVSPHSTWAHQNCNRLRVRGRSVNPDFQGKSGLEEMNVSLRSATFRLPKRRFGKSAI